jgi:hypothetical protein
MHDVDAGLTLGCCCVYTKEVPRVRTQRAERVKQMTREGGATRDRLWDASGPGECLFDSKEGTIVQTTYVNLRNRVFTPQIGGEKPQTQSSNKTGICSVGLFGLRSISPTVW